MGEAGGEVQLIREQIGRFNVLNRPIECACKQMLLFLLRKVILSPGNKMFEPEN